MTCSRGAHITITRRESAVGELRGTPPFREAIGGATGWLFPRAFAAEGHIPAEMLNEWLVIVETDARIPKLDGGLWHIWRRKWATERMHLPLKAIETRYWRVEGHGDADSVLPADAG